jgi:hypothetical protein
MNNIDEIDNLTRLTRRREFDDGLVDLLYGAVFLILSLANWFIFSADGLRWYVNAVAQQREITIIALLALVPAFLLVIYGMRRIVSRIRSSYLWKESGMVKPLRWQVSRSVVIAAASMVIVPIIAAAWLMARGVLTEEQTLRALPASTVLGTAVLYFGMSIELRIRRYGLVGVAGLILSAIVLVQAASLSDAWLLIGVGWMVIMAVSGLWALRQSVLKLAESPSE